MWNGVLSRLTRAIADGLRLAADQVAEDADRLGPSRVFRRVPPTAHPAPSRVAPRPSRRRGTGPSSGR